MGFKVGDRVRYIRTDNDDTVSYPHWGGKYGWVVGTIISIQDERRCSVRWEHNPEHRLCYFASIQLHNTSTGVVMKEKAKQIVDSTYAIIKPYEKYIGLVALAMVVDHFLLGNQFMSRFKTIAEALVTKITDGLDKLIAKLEV